MMTPQAFIEKWSHSTLKERSASQSHFNDLCALLGEQRSTNAGHEPRSAAHFVNHLLFCKFDYFENFGYN